MLAIGLERGGVNGGGREFVPAQATRILSRVQGQASPGRQSDPPDVGAAQPLVKLAGRPDRREADDLRRLAPQGLPPLLALEVRSWPATDPRRATKLDSENGAREPLVGGSQTSWC